MVTLVQPTVYMVGETAVVHDGPKDPDIELGINKYLRDIKASSWTSDAQSDEEYLVEVMGRMCYRSFSAGLNPNVTRVRVGNEKYIGHIVEVGHGSVVEHPIASFIFHGVSRVFTHELVRHRAGVAISQESLRFVRLDHLDFWLPDWALEDPTLMAMCLAKLKVDEDFQVALGKYFNLDDEKSFAVKKAKTSFMRRFAPDGLATSIGWTCNLRALRHVIEMRTAEGAEEEIRLVFGKLGRFAKRRWPSLFADYSENEKGEFVTEHRKV